MTEAAQHLRAFLDAVGLVGDPEVEGTADRVTELLASFAPSPLPAPTVCTATSESPVVVRGMAFHSLCAHHLLPFVVHLARRTQLQERLADQIAGALVRQVDPIAVSVGTRARHLCVEMRGARTPIDVLVVSHRGEPDPWLRARVEDP